MQVSRRDFLGSVAAGVIEAGASAGWARRSVADDVDNRPVFNVKLFGAAADGSTLDTSAVNLAIVAAAAAGGGTVRFPPGTYLCHSLRLKSFVALQLEPGAIIQAAPGGGYDTAEPNEPFERYQDFGHNHWHNSLIWGDGLRDVAIVGSGLICGRGLSRGVAPEPGLPPADTPGAADKAIAFKSCRNVAVRGIAILAAGHFGILATGVDNLTLENLTIDTNRDGINVDCCRNVRVSGCRVNSPWDDGICPKSSFALGYARPTENLTISNCYVTGGYQIGSVADGTWKPLSKEEKAVPTGRIKLGTESNGGFKNVTISNCVFESCQGFALETEDGAIVEDITFTGITMRDIRSAPLFLRLGTRLRGPEGTKPGLMRRVIISNITSLGASQLPSIISGVPGQVIEDVKLTDVFLQQAGGGSADMAAPMPPENEAKYPDPQMFGALPATGLFARHIRNLEVSNVEITTQTPDARPAFWLHDVDGADFFRVRVPKESPAFDLHNVKDFRCFGSRGVPDVTFDSVESRKI